MVKNIVIPAITLLRRQCRLSINAVLQVERRLDIGATIEPLYSDLELSDQFFDKIKLKWVYIL